MSVRPSRSGKITTSTLGSFAIKSLNALSLVVSVVGRIDDVTIPKSIVCKDVASRVQDAHNHFIRLYIGTLIAINKSHIEFYA